MQGNMHMESYASSVGRWMRTMVVFVELRADVGEVQILPKHLSSNTSLRKKSHHNRRCQVLDLAASCGRL